MKLYHWWISHASFRARIGLALKGIEAELIPIDIVNGAQWEDAYVAINPQSIVPTLDVDGTLITQSMAILESLEDIKPEPSFFPEDPLARARVRAIAQICACEIGPRLSNRVRHFAENYFDDPKAVDWLGYWSTQGFGALEAYVASNPDLGDFAHGDAPTLADIFIIPQLMAVRRRGFDLSPYKTLLRIEGNCLAHPAFIAAHPDNQPDKPKGAVN
jgi:maleylacetoacetate isomerase